MISLAQARPLGDADDPAAVHWTKITKAESNLIKSTPVGITCLGGSLFGVHKGVLKVPSHPTHVSLLRSIAESVDRGFSNGFHEVATPITPVYGDGDFTSDKPLTDEDLVPIVTEIAARTREMFPTYHRPPHNMDAVPGRMPFPNHPDTAFLVLLYQAPPKRLPDGRTKNGIHFIFPFLFVEKEDMVVVRDWWVRCCAQRFKRGGRNSAWDSTLDEAVYNKVGGLRLPFSHKFEHCNACKRSDSGACANCNGRRRIDMGRPYRLTHAILPDGTSYEPALKFAHERTFHELSMGSLRCPLLPGDEGIAKLTLPPGARTKEQIVQPRARRLKRHWRGGPMVPPVYDGWTYVNQESSAYKAIRKRAQSMHPRFAGLDFYWVVMSPKKDTVIAQTVATRFCPNKNGEHNGDRTTYFEVKPQSITAKCHCTCVGKPWDCHKWKGLRATLPDVFKDDIFPPSKDAPLLALDVAASGASKRFRVPQWSRINSGAFKALMGDLPTTAIWSDITGDAAAISPASLTASSFASKRTRSTGASTGSPTTHHAKSEAFLPPITLDIEKRTATVRGKEYRLSDEQCAAIELAQAGQSMFVTGPGGSGKSFLTPLLINAAMRRRNLQPHQVAITASTGTAAANLQLSASTLHSRLNLNVRAADTATIPALAIGGSRFRKKEIASIKLLIVDEVSMCTADLLEGVHCRLAGAQSTALKQSQPFGDVQIICVGDLFQLPPVYKTTIPQRKRLVVQSPLFMAGIRNVVMLRSNFRQTGDNTFFELLNRCRVGRPSREDEVLLTDHAAKGRFPESTSTSIVKHNITVDAINRRNFINVSGPSLKVNAISGVAFDSRISNHTKPSDESENEVAIQRLTSSVSVPALQELKRGMPVMLMSNIDVPLGLCNGAQGVVKELFIGTKPIEVDTCISRVSESTRASLATAALLSPFTPLPSPMYLDGVSVVVDFGERIGEHRIPLCCWTLRVQRKSMHHAFMWQFPLRPAWSITIHKSQSMSIDRVNISLNGVKAGNYGMAYAALSRARTLEGVRFMDVDPSTSPAKLCVADPRVVKWYDGVVSGDPVPVIHPIDESHMSSLSASACHAAQALRRSSPSFRAHPTLPNVYCVPSAEAASLFKDWNGLVG